MTDLVRLLPVKLEGADPPGNGLGSAIIGMAADGKERPAVKTSGGSRIYKRGGHERMDACCLYDHTLITFM